MYRIIFYLFRFYYAEIRRKLWPKALVKEGALGQMSKNFQVYFIHINFFKKPNKKNYNRAKELYCNVTLFIFWFCIVDLSKKKWKLKNNPRLPTLPYWKIEQFSLLHGLLNPPSYLKKNSKILNFIKKRMKLKWPQTIPKTYTRLFDTFDFCPNKKLVYYLKSSQKSLS